MNHRLASFLCSFLLVGVNVCFLYTIAGCPHLLAKRILPGMNLGLLMFVLIITFAVFLTWIYVVIVNRKEGKKGE